MLQKHNIIKIIPCWFKKLLSKYEHYYWFQKLNLSMLIYQHSFITTIMVLFIIIHAEKKGLNQVGS